MEDSEDISETITVQETEPEISLRKIDVSTKKSIDRLNALTKKFAEEEEVFEEVLIGSHKFKLTIPKHIIKQAASSDRESANKLAGLWAAQIMKNNEQLTSSPLIDPVSVWNEIKNAILRKKHLINF